MIRNTLVASVPYCRYSIFFSFFFHSVLEASSPMLLVGTLANGTEDGQKELCSILSFFSWTFGVIAVENLWLSGYLLPTNLSWGRLCAESLPLSCFTPPDVQISPGSTRVLALKASHLRMALMAASWKAASLSEQAERGIIWRQPYRKGLHNESVSENLRLAAVIDEGFIAACWSATSVTWRRPRRRLRRFAFWHAGVWICTFFKHMCL